MVSEPAPKLLLNENIVFGPPEAILTTLMDPGPVEVNVLLKVQVILSPGARLIPSIFLAPEL